MALGWTIINLFDYEKQLMKGAWRLPFYQCPVEASIKIDLIDTLRPIKDMVMCMRIAHAQETQD